MGFLQNLFIKRAQNIITVADKSYFDAKIKGQDLNITNAETNSTVFTCIDIISNTIAKCNIEIYKLDNGKKVKYESHKWYNTIRFNPDLKFSTHKWTANGITKMYFEGNQFLYVDFLNKRLRPLGDVEKVSPEHEGDIWYKFKGIDGWIPSKQLVHWYIISKDGGRTGLNPIDAIMSEMKIQKGGEGALKNYYENGLMNPLYLEADIEGSKLIDDKNKVKEFLNQTITKFGGWGNNHTIPQIPTLYKLKSLPQAQLDFLANNKYSISQIGALFKIPEAFLGTQNSTTYGKADQQVAFFNTCLSNVCAMITDSLENALLTIDERKAGVTIEFDFTNLYDTDPITKAGYLGQLHSRGAITPNEMRESFQLARIENEFMDYTYMQAQYLPVQLMDKNSLLNKNISITNVGGDSNTNNN